MTAAATIFTPHGFKRAGVFEVSAIAGVERSNGVYQVIEITTPTGTLTVTVSPSGRRMHADIRSGDIRVYKSGKRVA